MNLVETLTDPVNLATIGVATLSFATVVSLALPAMRGDKLDARMKSVANRRDELRRRSRAQLTGGSSNQNSLRHTDEGTIKKIVDQLQLSRLLEDPKVVDKLAQAGYRGPRPVTTFYFFRFMTPFVLGLIMGIYVYGLNVGHLAPMMKLCAVVGAFVAGFYAPNLYVSNRAAKRKESIMQAFPDALDLFADLRRGRHVDRGGDPEGGGRSGLGLHRTGGRADASYSGTQLSAGTAHGL